MKVAVKRALELVLYVSKSTAGAAARSGADRRAPGLCLAWAWPSLAWFARATAIPIKWLRQDSNKTRKMTAYKE